MSRTAFVVLGSAFFMGCLITREPVLNAPPNIPPSVLGSPQSAMNRIFEVHRDGTPTGGDAGAMGATEIEITAIIREVNVLDELEGRTYVNLGPRSPGEAFVQDRIRIPPEPASADPTRRTLTFTIPHSRLDLDCNTIELHVSRELQGLPSTLPADPDGVDIGTGVWFVAVTDNTNPEPDMSTCVGQGE